MRVLQITAGAGGMYCGSCLRDNALAAATVARGHDVSLLPVYTPTRTDEDNVSDGHVFLGGISVYLEQHVPLLRRTPAVLDWIWDRPSVIRLATGRAVTVEPRQLGELTVSTLKGEEGNQAKELRKLMKYLEGQPPFDVAVVPMSMLLGLAPPLKRTLGVPICCTLQGDDLFLDGLGEPWRSESLALIRKHAPAVDAFIATSAYYADYMAGYLGVPRERIRHVPLGINLQGTRRRRARRMPFRRSALRADRPREGLHQLAEAYRILRPGAGLPPAIWKRRVPRPRASPLPSAPSRRTWSRGAWQANSATAARRTARARSRVPARVDVFCVPSPYAGERGSICLEAMASGAPVVSPRHGTRSPRDHREDRGPALRAERATSLADRLLELLRDAEAAP